jgi:sensor histidine kinase YesM
MKNPLLRSKSAYWIAAFVSAAMAGLIFPANAWFRQGMQPGVMLREFSFGFVFTLAVWWYNLVGYPLLERRIFKKIKPHWPHLGRILTTLLFSYLVIWTDERLLILHIDDDLQGYVEREGANEFRAAITASFVLLVIYFLDVLRKFYQTQMENERLKLETSVAQFEALKQQVNPHFLFNSLNILKTMVKINDPKSEEYVVRLSDLYRNLLLSNQKEKASLEEELAVLENYLFMLKARFEDKLQVIQRIPSSANANFIPPLSLQMLVENCIKHNVVSTDKPLLIELFVENDCLVIRNNLQPKRSVEDSNHIGLDNLRQRYRALVGKEIEVEQTDAYFIVRLPFIN